MADPARLEVFRHRICAVAEEMGATLQRAAFSPNIKERLDFSCAVFDGQGRLLAQAAHIPVHLGAMPDAVAAACRRVRRWVTGDVVALNDPYHGGSHLPDITTVSPVFVAGRESPDMFVATRAHHADVGGMSPGSLPLARELVAEGLILPPVKLVRAGVTDEDLLQIVCANSRTPEERRGDIEAQLAAHHVGARRLAELAGADVGSFERSGDALIAYTRRLAAERLSRLREGKYEFVDALDNDGFAQEPLEIKVAVTVGPTGLTADFTGTALQARGPVNAPLSVTRSATYYVVACLLGDVPINAGTFATVSVVAPAGTLVNPEPPAAVSAGNVETSQRIVDVLLGALSGAAPDAIPAASQGSMNNVMIGGVDPRTGRPFSYYETMGGGAGGGPTSAGASAIQVHMTNTRNTPIEALEIAYPLRIERYGVRTGSGGQGRHRGGDGLERAMRFAAPARVTIVTERRSLRPWGLWGGSSGSPGTNVLVTAAASQVLPAKATFDAQTGDVLVISTPGGGGWGRNGRTRPQHSS